MPSTGGPSVHAPSITSVARRPPCPFPSVTSRHRSSGTHRRGVPKQKEKEKDTVTRRERNKGQDRIREDEQAKWPQEAVAIPCTHAPGCIYTYVFLSWVGDMNQQASQSRSVAQSGNGENLRPANTAYVIQRFCHRSIASAVQGLFQYYNCSLAARPI